MSADQRKDAMTDVSPALDLQTGAGRMLDRLSAAVWIFDIDHGRVVWANSAALDVWSADSLDELCARRMKDDMSPAVARRLQQYQVDFAERDAVFTELWTLYPRGVPRPMHVRFSGVRLADGRIGMFCEGREEAGLQPEAMRSADALLHTQLMISLHREDGRTLYLNPAARAAFEDKRDELADRFVQEDDYRKLVDAVQLQGETSLIARVHTSKGVRWHELTARACHDPASGCPSILVSEDDVSELKEAEALAQNLARHDPLTGLPNRLALSAIFQRLCRRAREKGARLGVFFIDLDQFKAINDTLGHQYGDMLLMEVARRLSALCGKHDAVIRLGGDEFLFLMTDESEEGEGLVGLAAKMLEQLSMPVNGDGRRLSVTPSIGIASFPDHGDDAQTLVQCADLAMYDAKMSGRNRYCLFQDDMRAYLENQLELLADLRDAFEGDQFEVYYQPRYSADRSRIVSVEALARWNHPERGLVFPAEFIPLCERTGLINQLGELILKRALCQRCEWSSLGVDVAVSVNVSLRQLSDPRFGTMVESLLRDTGCDGSRLELELTETLLVEGKRVVLDNLEEVRALGVRIAVDDFGTGYSNLARLSEMAIDCIKIDRSLIGGLPRNEAIVQMVIGMCKLMRVTIVAEGIETLAIANWAQRHGCHELQGYYFGRPMPARDLTAKLVSGSGAQRPEKRPRRRLRSR